MPSTMLTGLITMIIVVVTQHLRSDAGDYIFLSSNTRIEPLLSKVGIVTLKMLI